MKLARSRFVRAALAAVALTAAAALAPPARADIIKAQYANSTNYAYQVFHMPDLDQRRPGLPNEGNMYCVPTSTMNMMIYIANHGYPDLAPGPGNWQSQSKFPAATPNLFLMGLLMGTSGTGGTNGSGWFNGTKAWLNGSPYAWQFFVLKYSKGNGYWPRAHDLAKIASTGAMVSFAYGRYEYSGNPTVDFSAIALGARKGGHAITLARAEQSGSFSPITLHSRDPWHEVPEFNLGSQSAFANRVYNVRTHVNVNWPVLVNSLDAAAGAERVAIIDGYIAILPIFGYGYTPGGHVINIKKLNNIGGFTSPGPTTFDLGQGAIIKDITLHPDATSILAIAQVPGGPNQLLHVDGLTGQKTAIADFPTGKQMFFGRNRMLYLLEDDRLHEININVEPPKPGDPPPIQTMMLPFMADAVSFWDEDDRFMVLSSSAKKLNIYRTDPVANVFGLPPVFSFDLAIPLKGKTSAAVHPPPFDAGAGGPPPSMWIVSEASSSIFRINLNNGALLQTLTHPMIVNPTGISVNDAGELQVSTPDGLFEVKQSDLGPWVVMPSMFSDGEVFEKFYVARSRTNFHPILHDGPGWENILLEEDGDAVPDCFADLNHDGVVGVADLLLLLAAWGECTLPCPADLDFDDNVGVSDLLELLAAWGPCP